MIRFLEFIANHKLQLHLSQKEQFGIGPVVHKGVHVKCYCWASVADGGPTLIRHRFDVLFMLG